MDDLISRKALREAMYHEAFETNSEMQKWDSGCWIRYKMFENHLKDAPSVPAIPLDKLCEWLADNAYMYLTEEEMDVGYSSHDPFYWEMKLKKYMEDNKNAKKG